MHHPNPITPWITFRLVLLWIIIFILGMVTSVKADNPQLPCGTWQQGGVLIGCDLYQGSHPLPRLAKDCWKFINTRPGWQYIFSYGWFYLECNTGTPVTPVPFDNYIWVVVGLAGTVIFFNRNKLFKNEKV